MSPSAPTDASDSKTRPKQWRCSVYRGTENYRRAATSIVNAENIDIFKRLLKRVDFSYAMFNA